MSREPLPRCNGDAARARADSEQAVQDKLSGARARPDNEIRPLIAPVKLSRAPSWMRSTPSNRQTLSAMERKVSPVVKRRCRRDLRARSSSMSVPDIRLIDVR